MPSACPTLARALLFAPAVSRQAHSRLRSLTLADGAPWAPRKPRGLQCHIKRGREHSFQPLCFVTHKPARWNSLHPALQDVASNVHTASEGEGGAPPEASCPCPQGTKSWAIPIRCSAPTEGHRFVDGGMNLRHIQEEEQEARKQ